MSKRALIVVDVQNEYERGEFQIEYPPFATTVKNVGRAMDLAREHGVLVVVIQQNGSQDSPVFAYGSKVWQLHPEVASRPHDHRVEKLLPSALAGTGLGDWLRERGVDTLTVIGYMTQNCDDSTVKQAMHEGFTVEFLSDASGTLSLANRAGLVSAEELHRVMMVVMQSRFATVMSTDEWAGVLQGTLQIERDTILASHRRAQSLLGTAVVTA